MTPGRPTHLSLLGIPLELGAGEPGAIMGPAALRTAGLPGLLAGLGHHVVDHGDMAPPAPVAASLPAAAAACRNAGGIAAWTRAIHDRAFALAQGGGVPIFLGGDHSLSMGTVSGIARHCRAAGRKLVVLWIDAHADFNTPATSPSGNMHGMSTAFLCGDPTLRPLLGDRPFVPVAPVDIHLLGLRSVDAGERQALAAHGVNRIDMRLIDAFGVPALLQRILADIDGPDTHLHVSLDVDFLDPSLAPGVGTTVPGGASDREAHLVMEMLHDSGLVGSLDVVELNPFLDERGKSARLLTELTGSLFGSSVVERPARTPHLQETAA
ncbi:arginase [Limobrevibacterium gyesilva]|uniref:Arginase n=1 Tax=Limobrevibacterium gyesilva TaxID=2991712 RepID=A0AA41YKH0_9PROT|nr:arginase [Limobrevibacterium gyesilva]MCW3474011.1 arginase [Limobrevibacterium gyesilva]